MSDGPWLDFLLLALLLAIVGLLLRERLRALFTGARPAVEPARGRSNDFASLARQAGFDPGGLRFVFLASKLLLGAGLPLFLGEWSAAAGGPAPAWPVLATVGLGGFFAPDLWLRAVRRRRRARIRSGLSFFLDLLVALLHAGMGLTRAFREAGRSLRFGRSDPLAEEVELVALEMDLGKERGAAFEALAARTGVRELRGVAVAMRTGMRLGVSIEETLGAQAELLRDKRRQEAHQRINRAAVMALVPTLLCGFPILLLLIFFPAALELMEAIEALREYIR